ncbi:ribonuclease [Proteiniclasticum sp. SCR006]|uniref:Ribonuclease n=2 Tax=Proteiniclasticum aestuarii TaxID=2817862 RepID=A0A939KKS1_9CLOT|nr:ribonuclease domain-containing protein [Proteiniclasticum aestuarii]MBO1264945.1 ribonuclease [Proteiniclasticum aestuarii]
MRKLLKRSASLFLTLLLLFTFSGCSILEMELVEEGNAPQVENPSESEGETGVETPAIDEDGHYTSKDEVALYIHTYGRLPGNYIRKNDAMDLGWDASKGNLWDVTDEMSIGGDRFGNREGLLPDESGRQWYEADIDYEGGYRNALRIVYSSDGLIYYTDDHYESFKKLY